MERMISAAFREYAELAAAVAQDGDLQARVAAAATKAVSVLRGGGKLMFAGNGGSAAEAQHLAAEYVSRFKFDRPGLPAMALTTDTSILTAIGNDYGFDKVFSRQLEAVGRPGDLLFVSSTSGGSPNILTALTAARRMGVTSALLTGANYQPVADAPEFLFVVPSKETARIQEIHFLIGHSICEVVESQMFGS